MPKGTPKNETYNRVISKRDADALLSYAASNWKMAKAHEDIKIGTEFTTSEGVDNEREEGGSGLVADPAKRARWRVVAINTWHFTAEFISPDSRANGIRHSFTWSDVLTGKVRLC